MKGMVFKRKIATAGVAVFLALVTFLSAPLEILAAAKVVGYTDRYDGDVIKVVKQKSYNLVPGVTETDVVLNDQTGDAQVMGYMTTIEPSADVKFQATYDGYYDADKYDSKTKTSSWKVGDWGLSTTTHQLAAYEKATGENVIFATNGDYFNMQTGQPLGSLYINGNCLNPEKDKAEPYFAVLKDGSCVIRDAGTDKSDVLEAVSGPFYLVKDGKNVVPGTSELFPVNSIGFKADGSIVCFMADGRQYPRSVGMSINEMADFLVAQGVVRAIYLDGGGSATVVTRREGEQKYAIRNNPSDGSERNISSGLLLVANSIKDGKFHHAVISSPGDIYTPNSVVPFTAKGVDSAGGAAPLPESGLKWKLDGDFLSKGSIDENTGVFTSNGRTGDVTVELYYENKKIADSTIKIAEPDEIYFSSASASLDFGERSNLGLIVRAENADLNYKADDFQWTIEPLNPEDDQNALGHMDGNIFVAGTASESMHARVTASYKRNDGKDVSSSIIVEIGKMPVVAFDFEPNENGPLKGAHFHWGKSNYVDAGVTPGYYGDHEELTVPVANSNSINETVYATLRAPFRFTGNYDTSVPAAEIFKENGYAFYLWPNNSITHYCAGNVTTTSAANGGQVRFGEYAMELNFDYASYDGSSNSNYYVRNCRGTYDIEGRPTEVGVWVYADAKTYNLAGYTLHTDIGVFNGTSYSTKNFSLVHDDVNSEGKIVTTSAINWVGWKYCYANLAGIASYYTPEHPFKIRNGEGMIWLSYAPASGGGRYSGSFYFDNYRFVYGTNLDDLDNPYFKSLTVNGESIYNKSDVVLEANNVEITATFADVDGKNASGIDSGRTVISIDGKDVASDGDEASATTRLELANGLHSVSVTIYDKFGNTNTITSYVTIGEGSETDDKAVLTGEDTVVLGSDYKLSLVTQGSISSVDMTVLQLNSDFGEPTVTAAEGWDVDAVYSITGFKKAKMEISAKWVGEGEAPANAVVATLAFNVPTSLDPAIDFFTYQVTNASCVTTDGRTVTSAQQKVVLTLSAYYTIKTNVAMSGHDTVLKVVNPQGEPEEGVEVFVNGQSIGFTDAQGEIVTTITQSIPAGGSFTVIAKKGDLISFETTINVMNSVVNGEGKPEGLMHTATKNADTEQIITWFAPSTESNAAAVVEYSVNSDLSNATTVTGSNVLHAFATSKDAAFVNTVKLTGLESGRTYYYRAGDGKNWSEIRTFKTTVKNAPVSFFVVGDTQMNGNRKTDAEEIQLLKNLGTVVSGSDFGIQTGDYVDNGGNYRMWEEMDSTFDEAFGESDVIHTLGNHEYYGDAEGAAAKAIYGLSDSEKDYYSVEYGNVYVAVINNSANLSNACAWLVKDAKESTAQWKFLAIHQPPYYTNPNGGSQRFHNSIPKAAEEAGIDAVFSGHDHSYARTMPMTSGQIDEENGVVYFICGDLGEKSRNINYAAVNNPDFNFAITDQNYDAISVKVTATNDSLTFTTVDSQGNIIDTYQKESACAEGHDWKYYDRATGLMSCGKCGATANPKDELYSGWLTDVETGYLMYFISGKVTTGFARVENIAYAFDDEGLLNYTGLLCVDGNVYYAIEGYCVTGLHYINDKPYYFDPDSYCMVEGYKEVSVDNSNGLLAEDTGIIFEMNKEIRREEDGQLYYYVEGFKTSAGFVEVNGDYYYVLDGGRVAVGSAYVSRNNKLIKSGRYQFGEDGKLDLTGFKHGIVKENGGMYYYVLNKKVHAGLIQIGGDYYYVKGDCSVVTGKYYVYYTNGLMTRATYTFDEQGRMIRPDVPKNGIIAENGALYYYVNGERTYAGLIQIDGYYYYINSRCQVVNGTYYASKTNGLLPQDYYQFAEDGKLVFDENKNGIIEVDGVSYYYSKGVKTYAGLVLIDGDYYYINSKCQPAIGTRYVGTTNGLLPHDYYTFAEDGKLVLDYDKQGRVNVDGVWYFYKDGLRHYNGLTYEEGFGYYYANSTGRVVTGRYYVNKTNGLLSAGYYEFDEDGRMVEKDETDVEHPLEMNEEERVENTEETTEEESTEVVEESTQDGTTGIVESIPEESVSEDGSDELTDEVFDPIAE
ncbi:Exopolysaccharide biosynthesis protein related to N-acetylglucosamine-1-phosphodiester alpha-N-acetylglucosaminidase [Butyrivibrio fibrisolvens 16/4]|nr:Exopolysaccharide biosynthesis protein related to N-acetylglucosamine-1-phosphodiester alpha-N-acetylglucosaminidase [Butyrivibrio fibrisolvens 16/4]